MSEPGATATVAPDDAARLCDVYLAGLVSGDLDAVVSLFSENATVEDPVGSEVMQGRDALQAFYQIACDSVTAAERIGPPRIAGLDIAFAFVITIGESPNAMCIDIIDIFSCNEAGEVVAMRAYWGPENMRAPESA